MTSKREVVRSVLEGCQAPWVPWSLGFTLEAREKLQEHFGQADLTAVLDNHLLDLGNPIGFFRPANSGELQGLGADLVEDVFGVVWDRSVDKDIGIVRGTVLPEPTLRGYGFPDPLDRRFFEDIPGKIAAHGDGFRVFQIGFSLYERAWTLRGMENLLIDFIDNPGFVRELLNAIADYNIAQVHGALRYEIDGVYFGDDWGQQHGLQMGPKIWREFILPVLQRMYSAVHDSGKYVFIHSCGDVDELFPDLIQAGVNCFNPFQPEVMDVFELMKAYRGRLSFLGGLSTQRTLPFGTAADVKRETLKLLEYGRQGNYIFAPAHDVEGDVPLENMLAFLEVLQCQPGYVEAKRSLAMPAPATGTG
jgi:uroporphyrinogen decarboxylase